MPAIEPTPTALGTGTAVQQQQQKQQQAAAAAHTCLPFSHRRKQRQLEAQLTELGMEALDERLQMATQVGATFCAAGRRVACTCVSTA